MCYDLAGRSSSQVVCYPRVAYYLAIKRDGGDYYSLNNFGQGRNFDWDTGVSI
jgi:hypothetical protein